MRDVTIKGIHTLGVRNPGSSSVFAAIMLIAQR
jgi:hypothetical protein